MLHRQVKEVTLSLCMAKFQEPSNTLNSQKFEQSMEKIENNLEYPY